MPVVEVKNLVKNYGTIEAVKGISFSVNKGEIFGLIGPNGAGKTTTLRIVSTLLSITSGSIKIMDYNLQKEPDEIRKIISYLPEDAGAYKNLTGKRYLEFIANFFEQNNLQKMITKGEQIANLGDRINDKVDTYSKGMMRKLLVGRALMIDPKLATSTPLPIHLDIFSIIPLSFIFCISFRAF